MPTVNFITHAGIRHEVSADTGETLMDAALNYGIEEIYAECGGVCSCATCHCFIDEGWLSKVEEPDDMEDTMLDCVPERQPTSRLSCQIVITEELDGMVVRLPEDQ
jgi:2Fe-2S ferredoxin